LSPRWREIIRPVLETPRAFVLLPVRALAQRLGSDPATTLRIVRRLGFERYRDFQHYLHELSIAHATSLDRMRTSPGAGDVTATIEASLELDLAHVAALREHLEVARLARLAERVHRAERIALLGGDLARSLVEYLGYHLAILGLPCLTGTGPGQTVHLTRCLGRGDVVIALSFGRGLRQTVEGAKQARANGAHCVGVCDTMVSPLVRYTDETFLVSTETRSYGESYAAPMALLNAFLVACANARIERTLELLEDAAREQRSGYRWYPEHEEPA
jgi:DNA-binding MurR/RpiR family transcriptional regulator